VIPRRLVSALCGGLAALLYARFGRGYPWPLAVVLGTAVGALVWVAWRTAEQLSDLYRR
jgi:hypothetical protein